MKCPIDQAVLVITDRGGIEIDHQNGVYKRIVERPAPGTAPSSFINVSKYVLTPAMLQTVGAVTPDPQSGEYQIIDAINQQELGI